MTSSSLQRSTACSRSPRGRRRDWLVRLGPFQPGGSFFLSWQDREDDADDPGTGKEPTRVFPKILFPFLRLIESRLDSCLHRVEAAALARGDEEADDADNDKNQTELAHLRK